MPTISVRGEGPWQGLTRQSVMARAPGPLFTATNLYPSTDGMELRRMPGYKAVIDLSGSNGYERWTVEAERLIAGAATEAQRVYSYVKPAHIHGFRRVRNRVLIYGESDFRREILGRDDGARVLGTPPTEVTINSWLKDTPSAGKWQFTMSAAPYVTGANSVAAGDYVVVEDLEDVTEWEWQVYFVDGVSGSTINTTPVTGFSDPVTLTRGTGKMYRILFDLDSQARIWDRFPLTSWQVEQTPDTDTPVTSCRPAYVANTQRDFGHKTSVPANWVEGESGKPRRRQKQIPYRLVPDLAGKRLILSAPGYGCVFQIPVITPPTDLTDGGITAQWNNIYDRPRSLGLPKAVLLSTDPDDQYQAGDDDALVVNFAGDELAAGTYKFRAAYKDEATGEIGLSSEELSVTVDGTGKTIRIWILHPGYVMSECLGLAIMLWMSEVNAGTLGYLGTTTRDNKPLSGTVDSIDYGLAATAGGKARLYGAFEIDPAESRDLLTGKAFPTIEAMPMGAKASRTIRGITIFVGHLGSTGGSGELQEGESSYIYTHPATTNYPDREWLSIQTFANDLTKIDNPFNAAQPGIPSSYSGIQFTGPDGLFPGSTKTYRLNKVLNGYSLWDSPNGEYFKPQQGYQRWELERAPALEGDYVTNATKTSYMVLPRGQYTWSELDNPGVVPDVSTGFVSPEIEDDVEAIGRFGETAILCTKAQTYRLGWGRTPANQFPQMVSSQYGCIAPNSMVEYDGGLAWISSRGPFAMTAEGPRWIGEQIAPYFTGSTARYPRDSQNMLRYCWGVHDDTRSLVIWGMFSIDASTKIKTHQFSDIATSTGDPYQATDDGEPATVFYANATDKEKSRFPANELLVWSYKTGGFYIWEIDHDVYDMQMLECEDGQRRLCFLAEDQKIYAMDDAFAVHRTDPLEEGSTTTETDSSTFTGSAGVFATAEVDQRYIIYDTTSYVIQGEGTVDGVPTTSTLTLSGTHSWTDGSAILVGILPDARIETTYLGLGSQEQRGISEIGLRYGLYSRWSDVNTTVNSGVAGREGAPIRAWADAKVLTEKNASTAARAKGFSADDDGPKTLGTSFDYNSSRVMTILRGRASGTDLAVRMTFKGAAQVRIGDIFVEAHA